MFKVVSSLACLLMAVTASKVRTFAGANTDVIMPPKADNSTFGNTE